MPIKHGSLSTTQVKHGTMTPLVGKHNTTSVYGYYGITIQCDSGYSYYNVIYSPDKGTTWITCSSTNQRAEYYLTDTSPSIWFYVQSVNSGYVQRYNSSSSHESQTGTNGFPTYTPVVIRSPTFSCQKVSSGFRYKYTITASFPSRSLTNGWTSSDRSLMQVQGKIGSTSTSTYNVNLGSSLSLGSVTTSNYSTYQVTYYWSGRQFTYSGSM